MTDGLAAIASLEPMLEQPVLAQDPRENRNVLGISIDVRERRQGTTEVRSCFRMMPMARLAPFSIGTGGNFLRLN